jgi:hypothetical protein
MAQRPGKHGKRAEADEEHHGADRSFGAHVVPFGRSLALRS